MTARGQGKKQLEKIADQQAVAAGEEKGLAPAEAGLKAVRAARPKRKLNFRASGIGGREVKKPAAKARLKERAIFRYADGSFFPINSSKGKIDGLGLTSATDANSVVNINGSVRALSPGKGKTMYFSFGYADCVMRIRSNTSLWGLPPVYGGCGRPRKHGEKFQLTNLENWTPPSSSLELDTSKYGPC